MTRKTQYLIYRTGSNAANQPLSSEPVPVAIVEAASRDAACRIAMDEGVTVYNNQHLHAVPQSKAKKSDWNCIVEMDAFEEAGEENLEQNSDPDTERIEWETLCEERECQQREMID